VALTLHQHPFASYCWKALIALYELDISFEPKLVEDQDDRDELARLWPMGGIPVLVDDQAGLALPESTTIIEYLDRDHGRLVPRDADAALRPRLWDRIFDAHVMTPMQKIVADSLRPDDAKDPFGVSQARATLDTAYGLANARLGHVEWAGGDAFTVADCAGAASLFYARVVHRWDEQALPDLTRYFDALMARRSVARVVDEARPYRDVFPLPWPDYVD
jgi:glutathione S-transferase